MLVKSTYINIQLFEFAPTMAFTHLEKCDMLESTLTGERYAELLRNTIEEFLDDLNLADRAQVIFQQDSAPPHNSQAVAGLLTQLFHDRWISTRGPVLWPPRSPDLTPLDFYFWGFLKNEIYKNRYENTNDLQESISNIINNIDGRTILIAVRMVYKRAQKCVEENGNVFEHMI